MNLTRRTIIILAALIVLVGGAAAQADDMCREFGETPSRESGRDNRLVPFVYGQIVLKGLRPDVKPPRVVVIYSDTLQPANRQLIGRSGNYCFQKRGTGGTLVIDIDGVEVARKSVSDISSRGQREDFEITPPGQQTAPPGVISSKFTRPQNDKTTDLYKKAAVAEVDKDLKKAVAYVKEIVATDPDDFIAWAKLGSLYLDLNSPGEAESAFKRSLAVRADYTPGMLNLGIVYAVEKRFPEAIEIFNQAIKADPGSARSYRLLGESYLQNRQGTLGLAALDKALELDPVAMAECHLLKARLYDLAGAKNLATHEYKAYLAKVPEYADKKKLEKYIKDNPEN